MAVPRKRRIPMTDKPCPKCGAPPLDPAHNEIVYRLCLFSLYTESAFGAPLVYEGKCPRSKQTIKAELFRMRHSLEVADRSPAGAYEKPKEY